MITGTAAVAEVFNVLHDGVVRDYESGNGTLTLKVEIRYLAARVNPDFKGFQLRLCDVSRLRFLTWPKEENEAARTLLEPSQIFSPQPDILSGEARGDLLRVVLNQPGVECSHCGGDLEFVVSAVEVTDDSGEAWTLQQLLDLSGAYWSEWSEKNRS